MAKKEGVVQKQLNFQRFRHVKGPKMEGVVAHNIQKSHEKYWTSGKKSPNTNVCFSARSVN